MLEMIATYLVDNGVDEGEVDHLVRQKYFGGKSILEYVTKDDIYACNAAWAAAYSWITGEDFEYVRNDIDFRWKDLIV